MPLPRLVAVVTAALLALPACSGSSADDGSDDAAPPTSEAGADTPAEDAFPVTIEHMLGEATIDEQPTAVATLGTADFDTVVALGVQPIVGVHAPGQPGTVFPWLEGEVDPDALLLVDAEQLAVSAEAIIAEGPDLVLGTTANGTEADYEQYSGFGVPLIGPITAPYQDTWQERTTAIGQALGLSAEAEEAIAAAEQAIADFSADRPGLAGKTFVIANSIGGGQVRVVTAPTSSSARLLAELGLEVPEALAALEPEPDGAVTLSLEQLDLLNADVILLTGRDGDSSPVTDNPTFADLPAVERGTVLTYDRYLGTGLRTPSTLSIPWTLDQLDDVLTAVAEAPAVAGS